MATFTMNLAAGRAASPFYYEAKVLHRLCGKTSCPPVFVPTFSVIGFRQVSATAAAGQYVAIVNVQGIVTFTPCGSCCAKSQTVNETIDVPFFSATAPTAVSIASGSPFNALSYDGGCRKCCSNSFVSSIPVTLTITA